MRSGHPKRDFPIELSSSRKCMGALPETWQNSTSFEGGAPATHCPNVHMGAYLSNQVPISIANMSETVGVETAAEQSSMDGARQERDMVGILHGKFERAGAAKAYTNLMKRSFGEGLTDKNGGGLLPNLPKDAYLDGNFESKYRKPGAFAVISRTFISGDSRSKDNVSIQNLPSRPSVEDIRDMSDLQDELKRKALESMDSKLNIYILDKAKQAEIMNKGTVVTTLNDLQDTWKNELSKDNCKKFFDVFYGCFEDNVEAAADRIQFETMQSLGLWHSTKDNELNYSGDGVKRKLRKGALSTQFHNKLRDTFRSKVFNPAGRTHGVKLTVSGKAGLRRPRRKFVFETCVRGWNSDQHREWLRAKNSDQKDDSQVPATCRKKSKKEVTMVNDNKSSNEEEDHPKNNNDEGNSNNEGNSKLPAAFRKKISENKVTLPDDNLSEEEDDLNLPFRCNEKTNNGVDKDQHKLIDLIDTTSSVEDDMVETGLESGRQAIAVKKINPAAAVVTETAPTNREQGELAGYKKQLAVLQKRLKMTKKDNKQLNKQVVEAKSSAGQSNSVVATAVAKKVVAASARKVMSRHPFFSVQLFCLPKAYPPPPPIRGNP